jgi:chaperonin GroES
MVSPTATAVKITPLADRIAVRPLDDGEQLRGSIYIPDTAREKPQRGVVVAVGPGRYEEGVRVPVELAVGDMVLYARFGGIEVTIDGERYLILRETETLAVLP